MRRGRGIRSKRLVKTSVCLDPLVIAKLQSAWPGLSVSEVVRLAIDRTIYFSETKGELWGASSMASSMQTRKVKPK